MNELLAWDAALFRAINTGLANQLFDALMPFLRNAWFWVPLYVFLAGLVILNFGRRGLYLFLIGVLTIVITDKISSDILKLIFDRPRPCNDYFLRESVRLLIRCGSGLSFPSTHATNHFALAAFLGVTFGKYFRWLWPLMLFLAALVSFAQVYVGVHYPLDVTAGAVVGIILGVWFGIMGRAIFREPEELIS